VAGDDKQFGKEDSDSKRLWGRILTRSSDSAIVPSITGYAVAFLLIAMLPVLLASFLHNYGVSAAIISQPAAFFLCLLYFVRLGMEVRPHKYPLFKVILLFIFLVSLLNLLATIQFKLNICSDVFNIRGDVVVGENFNSNWDDPCDRFVFTLFLFIIGAIGVFNIGSYKLSSDFYVGSLIDNDNLFRKKIYTLCFLFIIAAIFISVTFDLERFSEVNRLEGVPLVYFLNLISWEFWVQVKLQLNGTSRYGQH